jgi:hypothetical protein
MLVKLPSFDEWASKTTLVYVNHKCVEMDDIDRSTHAKAIKLFLGEWERAGLHTLVLDGTADGEKKLDDTKKKSKI